MSALTLLLIEDEPQVRRFLRSSLEPTECKVLEASTGEAGLEMAASRHPDVILLDLGLPDLDGLEVTRRLREWTATPIIVLSARGQERDKVAALDAGADDYLTKPFDPDELRARIHVGQRTLDLMANIKRLTGLLPICSYCKRIRTDTDYWEQVESYITEHTDAHFSHGICPPCLAKVMGELDTAEVPPSGGTA
jgi:DNA-binding response OmpR family regulator